MSQVIRAIVLVCAMASLVAGSTSYAGHHEPVLQVVAVKVKPGMLDKYRKEVKKLRGVLERIGSEATVRMWSNNQGGPDAGTILVALEFPNAEAWAADSPKMQADKAWQDVLGDLHKLRTLEGSSMWRDISPVSAGSSPGSVLVVTGVSVNPGLLDTYRERLSQIPSINERLGVTATIRMWHATLAGPNTGNVAVGAEYRDLATYVRENATLSADPEWQGVLSGLSSIRTLQSRSLYLEITP
jgi:hypothetical protein